MKKDKYFRIVLLFNANKVYDRQVVEGVGEYLQASQCHWDVFIEEDFRTRLDNINHWVCDGIIADFDDPIITQHLSQSPLSVIGVGGSYHQAKDYPSVPYIATDNYQLIHQAFLHLKQKGLKHFAFYGLPAKNYPHWSNEREYAFRQLVTREKYPGIIYNGMDITQENWQHAQNRLSDWIQTLPPQTGIIAVTDARARHLLQVCDNLNINVPEEISIIGIDDEDMTRYLSRIALSSVVQGSRQMGYLAAKLLHQILEGHPTEQLPRILLNNIDGFISIERFQSLATEGKLLSLSWWKNEDAILQWKNNILHSKAQQEGKKSIFDFYKISIVKLERCYEFTSTHT